jgi:hypothetical protein
MMKVMKLNCRKKLNKVKEKKSSVMKTELCLIILEILLDI